MITFCQLALAGIVQSRRGPPASAGRQFERGHPVAKTHKEAIDLSVVACSIRATESSRARKCARNRGARSADPSACESRHGHLLAIHGQGATHSVPGPTFQFAGASKWGELSGRIIRGATLQSIFLEPGSTVKAAG